MVWWFILGFIITGVIFHAKDEAKRIAKEAECQRRIEEARRQGFYEAITQHKN